jgi:hypothetical protein
MARSIRLGFLGPFPFPRGNPFYEVGFPWISLDSLDRIETYQWVALDFPRTFFLEPCLDARSRKGRLRSRPFGRTGLFMAQAYSNF